MAGAALFVSEPQTNTLPGCLRSSSPMNVLTRFSCTMVAPAGHHAARLNGQSKTGVPTQMGSDLRFTSDRANSHEYLPAVVVVKYSDLAPAMRTPDLNQLMVDAA